MHSGETFGHVGDARRVKGEGGGGGAEGGGGQTHTDFAEIWQMSFFWHTS